MKTPQTVPAFRRWLQAAFDQIDAACSSDFFDLLDVAETVERASRLACRFGADHLLTPEQALTTQRDALAILGRLLAWTERSQRAELLSVAEVASLLGVSSRTVWRGVSAGEIPAPVKVVGSTRWKRADLETMLATLTSNGS